MPATKQISVLFVEDSPHDAELALVTLERSGYVIDAEIVFDHSGSSRRCSAAALT